MILIRHGMTEGNEQRRYTGRTDEPLSARGASLLVPLRSRYMQALSPSRLSAAAVPEDIAGSVPASFVAAGDVPAPSAAAGDVPAPSVAAGDVPASFVASGDVPAPSVAAKAVAIPFIAASPMRRCLETAQILFPGSDPLIIPEFREIDFGSFEGRTAKDLAGDAAYQSWIDSGGRLPFPGGESREAYIHRVCKGFERLCETLFHNSVAEAALVVHGGTIMAVLSSYFGGDYFDYQCPNGGGYTCTVEHIGSVPTIKELSPIHIG